MADGCPNCDALCSICQDNTWNWHKKYCNSCRLAIAHVKASIRKEIMSRVTDLKCCGKKDNCQELGELIEGYIPEWLGEKND